MDESTYTYVRTHIRTHDLPLPHFAFHSVQVGMAVLNMVAQLGDLGAGFLTLRSRGMAIEPGVGVGCIFGGKGEGIGR